MKASNILIVFISLFASIACAQENTTLASDSANMYSMNNTYTSYDNGMRYYLKGDTVPFTGFLCARYDNGELESVQQFENGIGNGIWIDYDPDGRKSCQGTYVNNEVQGPVTFYYEDGSIKSEGQYRSFKKPIGWWTFYDRAGNVVSKRKYTR